MALIRWTPFGDPFEEMDRMMKEYSLTPTGNASASFIPAVDLYETKDAVVVETPLAGVDPKDVHVAVEGDTLLISGETRKEREVEEKNYYRKEMRAGSFHRALPLPGKVDASAIKAEFENGILKITAPKLEKREPKQIEVQIKKK